MPEKEQVYVLSGKIQRIRKNKEMEEGEIWTKVILACTHTQFFSVSEK